MTTQIILTSTDIVSIKPRLLKMEIQDAIGKTITLASSSSNGTLVEAIIALQDSSEFTAQDESDIATVVSNHNPSNPTPEELAQENIETKTTAAADFSQYAVFDAYVLDRAIAIHSRAVMLVAIGAYLNLIKTTLNAILAALKILSPVNFGAIDPLPDFQLPPLSEVRDAVDNDLGV